MRAFFVALAVVCTACETVPAITYLDDAAPSDAADAGPSDAAETDATSDGSDGCPDIVPSTATSCCGPIACSGANCSATCADCMARCSLDQLCCPNGQNHAVCSSSGSCP